MRAERRFFFEEDVIGSRRGLTPDEVDQVQILLNETVTPQVNYDQITTDRNDFPLSEGRLQRLSTDAPRTITGFANVGTDIKIILNSGSQDLVIGHDNAGSVPTNRIICHNLANITLTASKSVIIYYDFTSNRVRTVGS